ncbi:EthD domain-containing protein [Novosphingobium rosa]|uniref:EthD domain-containing protein n=1 Tax=Novosphingobium rosa TaxID=76978 RepID=UPI00082C1BA6|nr:EthD domain-containing protein [Novosphingobium rosa]
MFKTTGLQIRRDGLTHRHYVDHWLNVHAPLSQAVEGLRGYVTNEVVLAGRAVGIGVSHPGFGADLDGIAQLHVETEDGVARMAATPEGERWFTDGPNFVGLRTGFLVEEHVVRPPGVGAARPAFKAICFARGGEVVDALADAAVPGALVRSRVVEVTGSTNLPGFEVPEIDRVIELWDHTGEGATAAGQRLHDALAVVGGLVGVVITHERVIQQPDQ